MSKLIPIDFEYNSTNESILNLVCACMVVNGVTERYWLHKADYTPLKKRLIELRDSKEYVFVCFNGDAEGGAFISLGLNPAKFVWIDLQIEWKMITNHCNLFRYGPQLIGGVEKVTSPKKNKYQMTEEEIIEDKKTGKHSPPDTNLSACLYKLLDVKIDTEHKTNSRNLIIRNNPKEIDENRQAILDYCESDIVYLLPALQKIIKFYQMASIYKKEEMFHRGDTSVRTSLMTRRGYPVNTTWTNNFYHNSALLIKKMQEDINQVLGISLFKYNKHKYSYSLDTKVVQSFISTQASAATWPKTKTGKFKTDQDTLERYWPHTGHSFRPTIDDQYIRFTKLNKSLNGFKPVNVALNKKSKPFSYSVGSDGRARPYLNAYGSQTARYQPKQTGFIFLKSAWMRAMVQPPIGRAIITADYSSQEFLLAALLSKDANMLQAYKSGDVYLYFAKLAKAVPWDGTKKDYKKERDLFKNVTLAMSYGMGVSQLAISLSQKMDEEISEERAMELRDLFINAYPDYYEYSKSIKNMYRGNNPLQLKDGWTLFCDNPSMLSVGNFPVQGMGSCILKKAIQLCQDNGLNVIFPLHDAIYVEVDAFDYASIDKLIHYMKEAFIFYFEGQTKEDAKCIRSDATTWGPQYNKGTLKTPNGVEVESYNIYIDPRTKDEYEKFKIYMEQPMPQSN